MAKLSSRPLGRVGVARQRSCFGIFSERNRLVDRAGVGVSRVGSSVDCRVELCGRWHPAPTAEWGLMISEGAQNIATGQWWISLFPGLALGLAVLAFAYAGEMLASARDVRRVVHPSTSVGLASRV